MASASSPRGRGSPTWVSYANDPAEERLRLFCFPNAGAGASVFRPWSGKLASGVRMALVQLPGRESRLGDDAYNRVEPLVEALADGLAPHLDPPFAFFGHSMGAILSYELTRRLEDEGLPAPEQVLVAARRAPGMPLRFPPMRDLDREPFLERLQELGGMPPELLEDEDLLELLLPTIRADVELCETHKPEDPDPMAADLTVFGGRDDEYVNREELETWRELTEGEFRLRMLEGGHFFLHEEQAAFMDALNEELRERVQATRP